MPAEVSNKMDEDIKDKNLDFDEETNAKKVKKSKKDKDKKQKKEKKEKKDKEKKKKKRKLEEDCEETPEVKPKKKKVKTESSEESDSSSNQKIKKETNGVESNHDNKVTVSNGNSDSTDDEQLSQKERDGAFKKFRLTERTVKLLKERGVTYLFPIQAKTFDYVYDGQDVIAQARTGTGKTLAFALPLIENLQDVEPKGGRPPKVLVMAPTRELAKQVSEDFESVGPYLSTVCIYGGTAYWPQESAIRRGVDIVVGTPGRILDYVRKNTLNLSQLRHVVLDEVDRMLDMGFAESVEEILAAAYKLDDYTATNPQTLLFTATLPDWVYKTSQKYMKPNTKRVDLIGQQRLKAATTVEHLAIRCHYKERAATISDVVQVYSGKYGRCMIFCETKKEANELGVNSNIRVDVQVLHGDIAQNQREITLKGFREGKFRCLVATDVAARGLDIAEVDLVLMCQPPKDLESYIHRSGRTGRAGRTGVSVCFYKPNEEYLLKLVERRAGIKFKRIGAPQPEDIILSSSNDAIKSLEQVPQSAIDNFRSIAEKLIEEKGAVEPLAAALAHMSGATEVTSRSLLNSEQGYTTYLFTCQIEMRTASYVWSAIGNQIPETVRQSIKGMRMCANKKGAVFDLPNDQIEELQQHWVNKWGCSLEQAVSLPELIDNAPPPSRYGNNNFRRGRFGGGSGGRGITRRDKGFGGHSKVKNNNFFRR
ncbi:nucleolar RNA helicase 2-like [Ptychodera flava]|uniref:nucleolar RNA helicase 2-like n=1 Tax=Ptychodera flava TaxID=63121 RepID=UPI003969D91B